MELQELLRCHVDTLKKRRSCPLLRAPYFFSIRTYPGVEDMVFVHSTVRSKTSLPAVKQANGAVFSIADSKLVALGMGKVRPLKGLPETLNSGESIQLAEDGTVLNVFVHAGDLFCTTSRRPDAKNARWASDRSFYDMLGDAIPGGHAALQSALRPGFTYSLVLRHPLNTVVINHDKPSVVHVATRRMEDLRECEVELPAWALRPKWLTIEEATGVVAAGDGTAGPPLARGVILIDRSDEVMVRRLILDAPAYKLASKLRKNKKHLHLSYLAGGEADRGCFRLVNPEAVGLFDHLDRLLEVLAAQIHPLYLQIFVRKEIPMADEHPFNPLLKACHKRYLQSRIGIDRSACREVVRGAYWAHLDAALNYLTRVN
jgi:hypothetical protein